MQTFLPYADFERTARALDDRRLGKQRVEALQILRALRRERYGWQRHPAVLMWSTYEPALVAYGLTICREWSARGHADTCAEKIAAEAGLTDLAEAATQPELARSGRLPDWLGDPELHRSHRSALVRKDPDNYRLVFPDAPADLPYVWPVRAAG